MSEVEKVGIIDLGSNNARLVLFYVLPTGNFRIFDELKENVRLGQDMRDDMLDKGRCEKTIATLKMFKRLCDVNGVSKILAFATSAVRRAKNQNGFLEQVASTCGIHFQVLTQEEESIYAYQGVINSLDVPKGLIMDIGGGSTQFIYYNRRNVLTTETIPYGAVTLTEMFSNEDYSSEERAHKIEEFFKEKLSAFEWMKNLDPDTQLVGVGGSFRNLGKISRMARKYPFAMAHNYNIPVNHFSSIYNTIKTMDLEKTKKIKGLSSARADILPAAFAAINSVIEVGSFDHMIISGAGVREGAMFRYAMPTTIDKPISDVLLHNVYGMLRFFDANIPHAEHVYNLSNQLYKELRVLHKLPRAYIKVLKTAALLHDTGAMIKYYEHQNHSAYIILNSNLFGISHKDIVMAAFVTAAHRTGEPFITELSRYKDMLTEEDKDAVSKLGVILKIAESFDRTQSALITGIECDVLGDSVIMKTSTVDKANVSLEIKDAMTCAPEFFKAYKKHLEII